MKINELVEGKEYNIKIPFMGLCKIEKGKLYYEIRGKYLVCNEEYNRVIEWDFEEVRQSMTFMDAIRWLERDPYHRVKYLGETYLMGGCFGTIFLVGNEELEDICFETHMIHGKWYKV